jgi:UDP-glucuronate decarboxylase
LPHDDPQQRKPDISLAQEKLGWQPTILLDEGLDRMIDYFKKKYTL